MVVDVVLGEHLTSVQCGDRDALIVDEDQDCGTSSSVADAEMVENPAMTQRDLAELVDGVEADTVLAQQG